MGVKEPKVLKRRMEGDERFLRILNGDTETRGMRSGFVVLDPGEAVGEHDTHAREEAIIFIQGKAEVTFGKGGKTDAGKGDVIYIPPGTIHDVRNAGEGKLKYLYVVAPVSER